jgi:CRP/FNR family transcriptional regulator
MPATMLSRYAESPGTRRLIPVASVTSVPTHLPFEPANVVRMGVTCLRCAMRNACVPGGLTPSELARFEGSVHAKRRMAARKHLYRAGDEARSFYAIRSGFIKTSITTDDGREQVTGFHMMGEVIGLEAIGGGRHASDAIALENTDVCEIPFTALDRLSHDMPTLQHKLYQMVGQEFQHEREVRVLLGTMRAEERLAAFLLSLGRRYHARGYSPVRFLLRMSRADIGSYLGLRLETVSRLFSRFQTEGLLRIDNKSVEILDSTALKLVIGRALN